MANPTTLKDPFHSPSREFYMNPYPTFKRMREEAPVFWSDKGHYWIVTRYEDAREILGDLHFEKGVKRWKPLDMAAKYLPMLNLASYRGKSMLNQNPPDHTRLRGLVNKAFTPSMITKLRPHIEEIANELLDKAQAKGHFDLVEDFTFPLPATVIAEMLGIPAQDRDRFKHWSHAITQILEPSPNVIDFAHTAHAYKELQTYLQPLIEERRTHPKEDLISSLVQAEEEGSKLSKEELIVNIILLLIAGHETTTNLIGNGTYALLQNPDQLKLLLDKPELVPMAVQECLRYDSPVQFVRRIADGEIMVGGTKVLDDQPVLVSIGAVNRDPAMFENPDAFDITRTNSNKSLAFGHGIHHCLGSSLAETEGQIALTTLFKRMPSLHLTSEKLERKEPFSLRGFKSLPVAF